MSYSGLGAESVSNLVSGTPVSVNPIQAWLKALGYTVRITGIWNDQTNTALRRYASQKGYAPVWDVSSDKKVLGFKANDPLIRSLRTEGSAAASRPVVRPPDGSGTPVPSVEPPPAPDGGSILTQDSIISGVPNWTIFGGVAAVAGYFAWKSTKKAA